MPTFSTLGSTCHVLGSPCHILGSTVMAIFSWRGESDFGGLGFSKGDFDSLSDCTIVYNLLRTMRDMSRNFQEQIRLKKFMTLFRNIRRKTACRCMTK